MPRPRTRGGLPAPASCPRCFAPSSPHARGSSLGSDVQVAIDPLVPARAGVFRPAVPAGSPPASRPRTRGGLPPPCDSRRPHPPSSPHARGSSVAPFRSKRDGPLVPARAGVFHAPAAPAIAARTRPRTRGGLPLPDRELGTLPASSPHARGSSPPPGRALPGVPARPRTRGGLPLSNMESDGDGFSSPHARGSSAQGRAELHLLLLVPARAGSSASGRLDPGHLDLVPARAGVFRSSSRPVQDLCTRPRTRGGLPSDPSGVGGTPASSPHARGLPGAG